jgi:hypothetical protein
VRRSSPTWPRSFFRRRPPDEKVFEWRPASVLVGKRFATEADVDSTLDSLSKELKDRVREGFTVVVK